jgi:hypothetical protein
MGFGAVEALITLCLILIFVFLGYYVVHRQSSGPSTGSSTGSSSTGSSSSNTSSNGVLSPATVPSKVTECTQTVSFSTDGVPSPIQCSNGDLNTYAWQSLAALEPKVLDLGYNATSQSVQATLCSDVKGNISNVIEENAYKIASLYYGWSFSINPTTVLTNGTCSNIDD